MDLDNGPPYVVITPVRDEARFIAETLESVCRQTVRPARWIIVDDGSKDNTAAIVRTFAGRHKWIELLCLRGATERFPGYPVVNAFAAGLKQLDKEPFEFIVKLDGDLRLAEGYFEGLMARFEKAPRLGIASGVYLEQNGRGWDPVPMPGYHAAGASKMVRRECFEDIGGFFPSIGWDTIDEIKARAKGWDTGHFKDLQFYHLKKEGSAIGKLRTCITHGKIFYLTGGSPHYFVFKALKRMILDRPPVVTGLLMTFGYLHAAFARRRLVTPEEASIYNALLSERLRKRSLRG